MGSKSGRRRRERERRVTGETPAPGADFAPVVGPSWSDASQAGVPAPSAAEEVPSAIASAREAPVMEPVRATLGAARSLAAAEAALHATGPNPGPTPAGHVPPLRRDPDLVWFPPGAAMSPASSPAAEASIPRPEERIAEALVQTWHWHDRQRTHDRIAHARAMQTWRFRVTALAGLLFGLLALALVLWTRSVGPLG